MASDTELALPQLGGEDLAFGSGRPVEGRPGRGDLGPILDVPVTVSAVLGHLRMPVGDLLKVGPGSVLELDRRVGEAVDILVNDRLVARGEVVLVEDRLGVTVTEIVRSDAA